MSPTLNSLSTITTLSMPFACRQCTVYGWKPEGREGATLTTIPIHKEGGKWVQERTYMFGGLSRDLYAEISYLIFEPMYNDYSWVHLYKGDINKKRYGHTTNTYEGKL